MMWDVSAPMDWLTAIRRYLFASAILHLVWETAQLPLYTLWQTGTARAIAFAVSHCTAGDLMIAALSLVSALVVFGRADWPARGAIEVAVTMIVIGVVYTIYSEWLNTVVRQSWAYTAAMPRLPWIGTGLSPVLQWIIVPLAAMQLARYSKRQL